MWILRYVFVALFIGALAVVPASADEGWTEEEEQQLALCSDHMRITRLTQIYENGKPTDKLNLYLETGAAMCAFFSFKADGYIVSIDASGLSTPWQNSRSTGSRHVFTPTWGIYEAKAHHYASFLGGPARHWGETGDSVSMERPPDDDELDPCFETGTCEAPYAPLGCPECDPVLIDTDRNGYHLTSADEGVLFDIDADGDLDRVAWTRPGSGDAWLAFDRNGNGRIDDGSELFGNRTFVFADSRLRVTAMNGFEALRFLESPPYGQTDGNNVIDSRDAAFGRLLLWTDLNHNGISEPDELRPVSSSGLRQIHTNYKESRKRDAHGNEFRQRAKGVFDNGEFFIYDVWLTRTR